MSSRSDIDAVARLARKEEWGGPNAKTEFLAAGEYNRNYLVRGPRGDLVVRINTGTQLGIEDQIEYEYSALEAVEPSGLTPRPIALGTRSPVFPRGYLVMQWLPGGELHYPLHAERAARLFARIHAVPVPTVMSRPLIHQVDPVADIVAESGSLLGRYADHPFVDVRRQLEAYLKRVRRLGERVKATFASERSVVANTEVNSGNFLVTDDSIFLVDWEKAVITPRYQDLGHFVVATTTLWKTTYRFSVEARRAFLKAYRQTLVDLEQQAPPFEQIDELTAALEATIVLRGLSWCYMAYYEYTTLDRPIKNERTFATIKRYLGEVEAFIDSITIP